MQTDHARSKNVKGEFEYLCLKCGREVAMKEVVGETIEAETLSLNA
jgi:DNA-directed RNA polymerase subunit RPC12/RpoP